MSEYPNDSDTGITAGCWVVSKEGNPADEGILKWEQRTLPDPAEDQILVKVVTAALNPIDVKVARGILPFSKTPFITGTDFAGIVVKAGAKRGFIVGQEVYGMGAGWRIMTWGKENPGGSLSEHMVCKGDSASLKPSNVSMNEAAALPLVAVTAQCAATDSSMKSGDRVIVLGASGGVGSAAVQMYKSMGCVVHGVCSGKNEEFVKGLGAEKIYDYTKGPWETLVAKEDLGTFDVVVDASPSGGVHNWEVTKNTEVLKKGGGFCALSGDDQAGDQKTTFGGMMAQGFKGMWRNMSSNYKFHNINPMVSTEKLKKITAMVEAGELKPQIDATFPMAEAKKAFEALNAQRSRGKIILTN